MNTTIEAPEQIAETQEMELQVSRVVDRTAHSRHALERREISVDRWDTNRRNVRQFGRLVDLSAGGLRIRTHDTAVKVDQQIRVRLELPDYAGISPFVDSTGPSLQPKREWVGWMSVNRIDALNDHE